MSLIPVGIDAISVYIPKLYIDIQSQWAQARYAQLNLTSADELASKVIHGIGIRKMSLCDVYEDSATMAAMAVKRLIDAYNIPLDEICMIAVGTETAVDQSKSLASYVIGMLEQVYKKPLTHCAAPQYQFACAGAMYALHSACNLFWSQQNTGKYAIVVATDIARYDLASSGESTQGAGAVALLISNNPKLLRIDPCAYGVCTLHERDFFRPNWRKTAVVDGKYSTNVYLNTMEKALIHYAANVSKFYNQENLDTFIDYLVCHVPYPRMAEYVSARFLPFLKASLSHLRSDSPERKFASDAERRAFEKDVRSDSLFKQHYAEIVAPSLVYAKDIGNIYSGSLFLALSSLLENANQASLINKRVLLCSYGSGATSLVLSGVVESDFASQIEKLPTRSLLSSERRIPVDIATYEYLHELSEGSSPSQDTSCSSLEHALQQRKYVHAPHNEFILERLGNSECDLGFRYYNYCAQ